MDPIKDKVVLHLWRKFGAFVTCVHITFKFGYKQPNNIQSILEQSIICSNEGFTSFIKNFLSNFY